MTELMEYQNPLYTVKHYNNGLFRVVKRLHEGVPCRDTSTDHTKVDIEGKFESALSRAKNTVREIALCNDWEYFVTLTFDSRWDRYDLAARVKELMQWLQNENKKGNKIKYLLVPEFHEDGAVHFHGLMSGIRIAPKPEYWPESVNLKKDGTYYDYWPEFSFRYGFSSVDPVQNDVAVGFYVSKYITKSLAEKAEFKGVHTYYRSQGLFRAAVVGYLFQRSEVLDSVCKFSNSFYSFGFCKFSDFDSAVCVCDEVSELYQSYVISDPVTKEIVSFAGGDDEDPEFQLIMDGFRRSQFSIHSFDECVFNDKEP